MKCLLTYKLSLSLFSPEITFENTNFSIISRETKTEIMCLSLSMSLRIFVNPGPGLILAEGNGSGKQTNRQICMHFYDLSSLIEKVSLTACL